MQGRENEYSGHCQVPCDKLQKLSEMVAEMTPQLEVAVEGVANFRAFQGDVREFIARQDERATAVAEHLKDQAQKDTDRRKNSQWRTGIVAVAILGLLGFLGQKAWQQITILTELENDWIHYYAQPPAVPPLPIAPQAPQAAPKHKSFWAQPLGSVKSHQQPAQDAGSYPTAP
jgi:hypothetical protein